MDVVVTLSGDTGDSYTPPPVVSQAAPPLSRQPTPSEQIPASPTLNTVGSQHHISVCVVLLFFFIDIVMVGMGPMFMRMEEVAICRAYYNRVDPDLVGPGGYVEEKLCKLDAVQSDLAFISGWLNFLEATPGNSSVLFSVFFSRIDSCSFGNSLKVPQALLT